MDDIAMDGNDLAVSTDGQDWRVAWHAAITLPLPQVGTMTSDGGPFVAPEIVLLFKAKTPRSKDQCDFDRVLPHLDQGARAWLAAALEQAYPATRARQALDGE